MKNRSNVTAHVAAGLVMAITLCGIPREALTAQISPGNEDAPLQVSEEVREARMVHVAPHVLVLTPNSKTATIELSNHGKVSAKASVVVELGYTVWADRDTALFSKPTGEPRAHDTVVANPGPRDRYAGRWISGYPTSVTLAPNEKKRITLRIDPPVDLPDGEYYARLVTIVAPPSPKPSNTKTKDSRTIYKLPVSGKGLQSLRDSVRIFYRTGKVTMGLRLSNGKAEFNPEKAGPLSETHKQHVWTMFNFENTGNAQVEGAMQVVFQAENGDEIPLTVDPGNAMAVYGKGTMRWYAEVRPSGGRYRIIVKFLPFQDEFPVGQRIPMDTAQIVMPFDVR